MCETFPVLFVAGGSNVGANGAEGGPLHGAAPALRPAKSPLPHPSPPLQRAGRPSLCITVGPAPHFAVVLGGPKAVNSLVLGNLLGWIVRLDEAICSRIVRVRLVRELVVH